MTRSTLSFREKLWESEKKQLRKATPRKQRRLLSNSLGPKNILGDPAWKDYEDEVI